MNRIALSSPVAPFRALFCLSVLFFCISCSSSNSAPEDAQSAQAIEDEEAIYDPFEGWNRGVHWFNDRADRYVLEPVSEGYDYVVPDPVQQGVRNVFETLQYPQFLVSSVVQLKFKQAARHTGRFLVNATLGVAGIFDVASKMGLEKHREDFGTALGYHGVGPGPYLVLPFLGPSNVRDGMGRLVDNFLNPVPWIAAATADGDDATAIALGVTAIDVIQTRSDLDEAIEAAREASVDNYLFVQKAYYQLREAAIEDKSVDQSKREEAPEDPFAEDEAFDEEFNAQ